MHWEGVCTPSIYGVWKTFEWIRISGCTSLEWEGRMIRSGIFGSKLINGSCIWELTITHRLKRGLDLREKSDRHMSFGVWGLVNHVVLIGDGRVLYWELLKGTFGVLERGIRYLCENMVEDTTIHWRAFGHWIWIRSHFSSRRRKNSSERNQRIILRLGLVLELQRSNLWDNRKFHLRGELEQEWSFRGKMIVSPTMECSNMFSWEIAVMQCHSANISVFVWMMIPLSVKVNW
mgnify:FL=1